MSKKRWWEMSSAADDGALDLDDDGPEIVEQDDDGDWIDSFRFDDYRADRGLSSVDSIWNRYGGYGSSFGAGYAALSKYNTVDIKTAKRVEGAQKLVQGFVDTFALGNPLRARFDAQGGTAPGAEEGEKAVVVSHRPLLDPTLGQHEANEIMTAQAANAAARARFGGAESSIRKKVAVAHAFHARLDGTLAIEVSDILDGYRIDRRFREDYPGYSEVYAPAQAYVAKGLLGDRSSFNVSDFAGASIANAALNYAAWTDWSGAESEREWWTNWAEHFATGDVTLHAEGVVAALEHLRDAAPPVLPDKDKGESDDESETKQDDKGDDTGSSSGAGAEGGDDEKQDESEGEGGGDEKGDDESEGEGGGDEKGDDESEGEGGGDEKGDDESDARTLPSDGNGNGNGEQGDGDDQDAEADESEGNGKSAEPKVALPTSLGTGVSLTGLANGQTEDLDESQAEDLAQSASAMAIGLNENEVGEVYWTARGVRSGTSARAHVKPESSANGYIRRAFTRSRTSHYSVERGHRNGRIDNRSLPRIASDDYRLFSKRTAPSDTRYRVWLLVDNSGSMGTSRRGEGPQAQAMNLAAAVALATRSVPNVTMDVWAWTSGIKIAGATFSAVRVWSSGDPISTIGDIAALPQGGTPDAETLSWAAREIRKQCRPDETPVILVASDGQGDLQAEAVWRDPVYRARRGLIGDDTSLPVRDRVADARKGGVKVLGVAIGNLIASQQDAIYGKGNHLVWNGSIKTMAKPLGDLLARIASGYKS